MLKYSTTARPFVIFNANNKEHRKEFFKFIEFRTWSKSPYRFLTEEAVNNIPAYISQKITEYYIKKEFTKK